MYENNLKTVMESKKSLDISSIKHLIDSIDALSQIMPQIESKKYISTLVSHRIDEVIAEIHQNVEKFSNLVLVYFLQFQFYYVATNQDITTLD